MVHCGVTDSSTTIAETLRGRILRGIQGGAIRGGDRLPSARDLVEEFDVDHRLVLAAYRQLAHEGLVEIRERGGVYVSRSTPQAEHAMLSPSWITEVFAEGLAREIPPSELAQWLARSVETLRLRACVITSTDDQAAGLARELRDDFGLHAVGIAMAHAADPAVSTELRRADLILATAKHADEARQLAEDHRLPLIMIDVRPDLAVEDWGLLLRQPVWAIVATREFGAMLRKFFSKVKGAENLHILVHGEDDLSVIPDGAPTYITQRVRETLGMTVIRGRVLPPARTIAVQSARAILDFMVRANLRAIDGVRSAASGVGRQA